MINKVSYEGRERYLFFLSEGDFFNPYAIDGRNTTTSAKAHTNSKFLKLHKDRALELMEMDFKFNMILVRAISVLARRTQRQILNVGIYDTRERLASRLWKLARDYGIKRDGRIEIALPLTQTDLSNIIGTSRETVNRGLKQLEDDKIIYMDNGIINIVDLDRLIKDLK